MRALVLGLAVLALVSTAGCKRRRFADPAPPTTGKQLDVSFDTVYDAVLVRNRSDGERAVDWNEKYFGNWVRWTGTIMSFTDHSITLRHRKSTTTFDVSLGLTGAELADAQRRYHKGSVISYMGKLDSIDDIFRTIYIVQGVILEAPAQ